MNDSTPQAAVSGIWCPWAAVLCYPGNRTRPTLETNDAIRNQTVNQSAPRKKFAWNIWVGKSWVASGWSTDLADAEKDASRAVLSELEWDQDPT